MLVSCPCLNVAVDTLTENQNGRVDENNLRPPERLVLTDQEKADSFFASFDTNLVEVIRKDEKSIVERIPALVEKRNVAGWEIRKCILCGLDAFAINVLSQSRILLNRQLLKQQPDLHKSSRISEIFNLILPTQSKQFEQSVVNRLNSEKTKFEEQARVAAVCESLQQLTIDYLKRQQQIVEERIQKFTEEQHACLEKITENAKQEKQRFITCLFGQTSAQSRTDDGMDSALALSPASIISTGDPSTSILEPCVVIPSSMRPISTIDAAQNVLRPKTNSNPVSLTAYKRKRHSGGSAKAPVLSSDDTDDNQGVFCLDEQEGNNDDLFPPQWHMGEELDTDDSGHGEDYGKYYPPANNISAKPIGRVAVAKDTSKTAQFDGYHDDDDDDDENEADNAYANQVLNQFGTSLPVKIPLGGAPGGFSNVAPFARIPSTEEEPPADVGASMQALARSIQAVDDPERLFGERPRRRWKTGEIVPNTVAAAVASRNFVVNSRHQPQPF